MSEKNSCAGSCNMSCPRALSRCAAIISPVLDDGDNQPPCIPPKRVQRPRLIQRLNEGMAYNQQDTLVSAPVGFGKSACVSKWVEGLDMPLAWLSLDPGDDDAGRFFTNLVAALQVVDIDIAGEIEGILRAIFLAVYEILIGVRLIKLGQEIMNEKA